MLGYTAVRHATRFASVLFAWSLVVSVASGEQLPPVPKDYFNDYAGVISASVKSSLNHRLAQFDRDTTNQVVVAIFPRMESTSSLDDYTLRIAKAWGVGQRGKNNGVALFVFVQNHTMRIQVGFGLTNVLTDGRSKGILDRDLGPHFRRGDFDGGLTAGVDSILKIVKEAKFSGRSKEK